jgi:hypothetical protein
MQLELRSAHVPGEASERLSLDALNEDETHVHGELAWTIGERRVPSMGFWSPEDVCLGEWWDELSGAVSALAEGQPYTLDSCEQGNPAFHFSRSGDSVQLSIVAGMGGGEPRPEWTNVDFDWDDLVAALQRFKRELRQWLESGGPAELPREWRVRFSELA